MAPRLGINIHDGTHANPRDWIWEVSGKSGVRGGVQEGGEEEEEVGGGGVAHEKGKKCHYRLNINSRTRSLALNLLLAWNEIPGNRFIPSGHFFYIPNLNPRTFHNAHESRER